MIVADVVTRINLAALLLISILPAKLAISLAGKVGALKYRWIAYRYPRDLGSIVMYMSSRLRISDDQAVTALRRSFELLEIQDLEGILLTRLTRDNLTRMVTFEGLENLNAALEHGRGVLLFSGHTMSVFTMLVGLKLLGYSITINRDGRYLLQDRSISGWLIRRQMQALDRVGIEVLYHSDAGPFTATRELNALKRNQVVVILVDAMIPRRSVVEVDFLHEVTRLSPGCAMLAVISGAPMLPLWSRRVEKSVPLIGLIGPAIPAGKDVKSVVRQQVQFLESEILREPASWRRWLMMLLRLQKHREQDD